AKSLFAQTLFPEALFAETLFPEALFAETLFAQAFLTQAVLAQARGLLARRDRDVLPEARDPDLGHRLSDGRLDLGLLSRRQLNSYFFRHSRDSPFSAAALLRKRETRGRSEEHT